LLEHFQCAVHHKRLSSCMQKRNIFSFECGFFFFFLLCLLHQPYTFEIKMVSIFVNLKKYIYFFKNVLEIVVFNFLTFNIRFDITLLITFSPPTYPYLPFFHTFLHFFFVCRSLKWGSSALCNQTYLRIKDSLYMEIERERMGAGNEDSSSTPLLISFHLIFLVTCCTHLFLSVTGKVRSDNILF